MQQRSSVPELRSIFNHQHAAAAALESFVDVAAYNFGPPTEGGDE